MSGSPVEDASVIRKDAPIPVLMQEHDGSFRNAGTTVAADLPEPKLTDPLPQDAGSTRAKPEFEVPVGQAMAQASGLAVPAPAQPAQFKPSVSNYTPPPTPAPPAKRVRVRMSNPGMGRVTVGVRAVSISETVVILAYPQDADNIVEPPVCGGDNPIRVEFEGKRYTCVFGGWTTELEGMFLVVLLRTGEDEDPSPSKA